MNCKNFTASIPEVPPVAESLVDVGNKCTSCDRNMGMFSVANICQYCRKQPQENGDTIVKIARFSGGEGERLPNDTITLDEDGTVSIMKGKHRDVTWLNGPPNLSEGDTFFFGPFVYRVVFEDR